MKLTVLVQLVLKLTPCAQVKLDINGDMQTMDFMMQERASLLNASQKQVNSVQGRQTEIMSSASMAVLSHCQLSTRGFHYPKAVLELMKGGCVNLGTRGGGGPKTREFGGHA